MFRYESPVTQTQDLLVKLRMFQKAALESDFRGNFNLALGTMFLDVWKEQFFLGQHVFPPNEIIKIKRVAIRLGRAAL